MSDSITDVYAVVDKTKKIKNITVSSSHQEVTDIYAVVNKAKKSKSNIDDENSGDRVITIDPECYNSATMADTEETYYCSINSEPKKDPKTDSKVLLGTDNMSTSESRSVLHKKNILECIKETNLGSLSPLLVLGYVILFCLFVSALVALIVAFALIAGLQSDITELSRKSTNKSVANCPINQINCNIMKLESQIQNYLRESEQRFNDIQYNISFKILTLEEETNNLNEIKCRLSQLLTVTDTSISEIQRNVSENFMVHVLNVRAFIEETPRYVGNASITSQNIVHEFTSKIIHDIQALHVFENCNVIRTLSLPFGSSVYLVAASNRSSVPTYCNTDLPAPYNNGGVWRRIAYIYTIDTTMPVCPAGLEARATPPSCKRNNFTAGCSSVIFPVRGNYSCVYGRIIAHQSGDPDGFTNSLERNRSDSCIEGNYVDGLSLTYGNNPRQHIWTFAASISSFHGPFNCSRCRHLAPSFIDSHYTCDTFSRCGNGTTVCSNPLWMGSNCSSGDATFYRQLPVPTSEDIEMRVCRDQNRTDEDLLLMLVEFM